MQAHYEALYSMLMLISIELANEEVMVDLIRLVLAVQVGRSWVCCWHLSLLGWAGWDVVGRREPLGGDCFGVGVSEEATHLL